jgi:hypothetical protein
MVGKPSPHRCNLAIWKQSYDPPPLQIAHDCSVATVLAKSPVINAGDDQRLRSRAGSSPNNPQKSIVAHRQHQSLGEARCRPAAECARLRHKGGDPPSRQSATTKKNQTPPTRQKPKHTHPPLIRWSIQEIRRIAIRLAQKRIQPAHVIAWSFWRRAHQAAAQRAHLKAKRQL